MDEFTWYHNGKWLPQSQVSLDPNDRGVTLGDQVVDVERTFRGKGFRIKEHIDRLYTEYTKYNYNPIINPYYTILENGYRIDVKLKKLKIESKECKLINNCNDKDGIKLKNINNYNFFYNN